MHEVTRERSSGSNSMPPIVLVGPTATGKTDVACALAEQIGGEIINADSMQVYRGMDIGTAKPDAALRRQIRFHLLDVVSPDQPFTVADWKERAEAALMEIAARGHRAILCGGTGLYVRALLEDWTLAETPADPQIRARLQEEAKESGPADLHARLLAVDPVTAARLHAHDAVRVIRALEVFLVSGRPISTFQEEDRARRQPRPALRFGLTLPRPELYARIDRRVEQMMAAGWEVEVRRLLSEGFSPDLHPLKSLGYKELIAHIRGEWDLETAMCAIQQNTRRYAKRQQTWFHADPAIHWINVSALASAEVADQIREQALFPA